MYKLYKYLFGWDYIHWSNSADQGVARVHKTLDGTVWYWRYRITSIVDEIKSPNEVIWLTCSSSKYFPS